jgi:acetylornithine deacetylase/succinyl-diaminopimelate desuccinylase family protein
MQDTKSHIEGFRAQAIELLSNLVRFESITGQEKQIGAFVADYCRSLGLQTEIIEAEPGRPNVIASFDTGRPGPTLLLNDHLDIVPPGPLELWESPPFEPTIRNGRIIGRGTIDTKSGVTTILVAILALKGQLARMSGRLVLIFTCDEETGGVLGMQYLAGCGLLKADLALVAEPTSLRIETATKGRMSVAITTTGVATHGARPWLGQNAIEDMVAIVANLATLAERLAKRTHPRMGRASLNIGTIDGGTVPNMVPNRCRIEVDRRLLPGETRESILAEFDDAIAAAQATRPALRATIEERVWWPGYMLDNDSQVVTLASNAFAKIVGRPAEIGVKDAGTDASWIYNLANIPVVMFSPGHGPSAMNANESVAIDDLIVATSVVAQFVLDVLATP